MIRFAENLNKMITAGLGGPLDPPRTEVAVGHRVVYTEASGAMASFETNVIAPVKNLRVTMEPIQAGSGDPSPENVRPINGRQSVTVTRAGVNVWNEEWESGSYDVNGLPNADPSRIRTANPISVVGGTSYYMKAPNTLGIRYYDINDVFISGGYTTTVMNRMSVAPDNAAYLRFSVVGVTTYGDDISINYPSTDHDYHPGTVASVEVQLGQTVYGGTVDFTTGVLTVEWENIASYDGEALPGEWISDRDAYAPGTTPTTGAQVCYKLATPITIDLTSAQLTTVLGVNNVWSDAGDVTLEYPYYEETEGY